MFAEDSSQHLKGESPIDPKQNTASLSWLKKISQWFSKAGKKAKTVSSKEKLHQLEEAKNAEKKILLEQRNFYEKLFSRSPADKNKKISPVFGKAPEIPIAPEVTLTVPTPPPSILTTPKPQPTPSAISTPPSSAPVTMPLVKPPVPLTIEKSQPTTQSESISEKPTDLKTVSKIPVPVAPTLNQKKSFFSNIFSHFFSKDLAAKLAEERKKEETWQERNSVEQRFWQPSNGIKPNLIKDQEIIFFNWHENILVLSLSLVMCCLAISLAYVGLLIWQKERVEASKTAFLNVSVIDSQIKKSEQEVAEIKDFNNKLGIVSGLLDNHIYWTNFLTLLEFTTLKDVYYEKFTGDITGQYSIPAVASSLEAISLQLDVMKKYNKVKSVAPDTGQTSPDGKLVQFNLGLTVDPTVFTK